MGSSLLFVASGGSLVDIDGTFFIQMGIFLVMFVFLYFALFRPVIQLIEARRDQTDGKQERAAAISDKAQKLSDDIDEQLRDIRTAAAAERGRLIDQARQQERTVLDKASDTASGEVKKARSKMAAKAAETRRQLEQEVDGLVDQVAERLINKTA